MVLVLVVVVEIYYEHVIGDGVIFMAGSSVSGNSKKEEDEGEAVSLLRLMLRRRPLLLMLLPYYYGVGTDTVVDVLPSYDIMTHLCCRVSISPLTLLLVKARMASDCCC